ncbi:hypothetical protein GQX73_g3412 [Xylaria multiplex]|uniref:Ceramidase n=1 Tax=Xylaria multiplex TaxID=323545 RepID=A0A7C8MX00_9PEZI|nr:hypothetical protein GQX73_g3412 [Xylaria multiplex]
MYGPGSCGLFAPRFDFMSISLLVLGIASFLFHASLRQNLQFGDELAMLGIVWSILQGLLTVRRSSAYDRFINTSLAVVFPLFAVFYLWTGKIIYHVIGFAFAIAVIIIRGVYLFYWRRPGFPEIKVAEWRVRGLIALVLMGVAYILWHIDLEFCAELRELRGHLGLPWAWLLEMHGWWHILTAMSAARIMDIAEHFHDDNPLHNGSEHALQPLLGARARHAAVPQLPAAERAGAGDADQHDASAADDDRGQHAQRQVQCVAPHSLSHPITTTITNPLFPPLETEDGREMKLDGETLGIKGIIEEVDRHSRALQKQADLTET